MAEVTVRMTADAAKLMAEQAKALGQQDKIIQKLKEEAATSAKLSKDQQANIRQQVVAEKEKQKTVAEGKRLTQSLLTPQQKYNASLDEANRLQRAGAITAETYKRRVTQLKDEFAKASQQSKSFTSTINLSAAAYGAVGIAIATVNKLVAEQGQLQNESLTTVQKIAKAQQEAIKNLTGLSYVQKGEALDAATAIQGRTGFSEQSFLVDAIGAGYSASGNLTATLSSVEAASRLSMLTPEKVRSISAGALDVARGSGIGDAEQNLGFLLSAGSVSRVEDPEKLAKTLAPAVASGVETVKGQDRVEAAREIAAIFGTLTKAGTDTEGSSTQTATITLLSKMNEFFSAPERANVAGADTVFGRLRALQSSPELQAEFLKNEFGEAKFKEGFKGLVAGGALAQETFANKGAVTFDAQVYRDNVRQAQSLTPQVSIATIAAQVEGAKQTFDNDPSIATMAAINKISDEALPRVRPGGFTGLANAGMTTTVGFVDRMMFAEPESLAEYRKSQFAARRDYFERGGITADEAPKIAFIDKQVEAIDRLIAELKAQRSTPERNESLENAASNLNGAAQAMRNGGPSPAAARAQANSAVTASGY